LFFCIAYEDEPKCYSSEFRHLLSGTDDNDDDNDDNNNDDNDNDNVMIMIMIDGLMLILL